MRACSIALLSLSLGCVESVIVGPPPLDPSDETNSVIMLVERDDPSAELFDRILLAAAAGAGSRMALPPFSAAPDERLLIHALLYEETLEELDLREGPLQLSAITEACRAEADEVVRVDPLPEPEIAWVVEQAGNDASEWTALDRDRLDELRQLNIEHRVSNPCIRFRMHDGIFGEECPDGSCERRTVFVAPAGSFAWIGRVKEDGGLRTGSVYTARPFAEIDRIESETGTVAIAGTARDGALLLLDDRGRFSCLAEDRACTTELPPLPANDHRFASLARGASNVHYALRDDGKLWRSYGGDWREIPIPAATPCEAGDLFCRVQVAARDDRAFVMVPHLGAAYYVDGAELIAASLPPSSLLDDVPLSVWIGSEGYAIGTSRGRLLIETSANGWRHVASIGQQSIHAVTALSSGLLFGGSDGLVAQWHPGFGVCAELGLGFSQITDIVPVGRDFVVTGTRRRDLVWLERLDEPADPCPPENLQIDDP